MQHLPTVVMITEEWILIALALEAMLTPILCLKVLPDGAPQNISMLGYHNSGWQTHTGVVLAIKIRLCACYTGHCVQRGLTHLVWAPPRLWELRQLCRLPPTANSQILSTAGASNLSSKHMGLDTIWKLKAFGGCVQVQLQSVCGVYRYKGQSLLERGFFP
jgi:hypothetical protein